MTDLTPTERTHALEIAEAIHAAYYDADSSLVSQAASDSLVDTSLTLAVALIALEAREKRLTDENKQLREEVESQLDYIGTLEDDLEEARGASN